MDVVLIVLTLFILAVACMVGIVAILNAGAREQDVIDEVRGPINERAAMLRERHEGRAETVLVLVCPRCDEPKAITTGTTLWTLPPDDQRIAVRCSNCEHLVELRDYQPFDGVA